MLQIKNDDVSTITNVAKLKWQSGDDGSLIYCCWLATPQIPAGTKTWFPDSDAMIGGVRCYLHVKILSPSFVPEFNTSFSMI